MRTFSADIVAAIEAGALQKGWLGHYHRNYDLRPNQITSMRLTESISGGSDPLQIGSYVPAKMTLNAVPGRFPELLAAIIENATKSNPDGYRIMAEYPDTEEFDYSPYCVLIPDDTLHETTTLEGEERFPAFLARLRCSKTPAITHDLQSNVRSITYLNKIVLPYNYTYGTKFADIPPVLEDGTLAQRELFCYVAQACGRFLQTATGGVKFFIYDKTQTPAVIPSSKIISLRCARVDKVVKNIEVFDTSDNIYSRGISTETDWRDNYIKITVKDNPLITSLIGSDVCDNLYTDWYDFTYTPYRLTMPQDPRIEVGDRIRFTDYDGNTRTSYVAEISRQFNGAQTLSMGM